MKHCLTTFALVFASSLSLLAEDLLIDDFTAVDSAQPLTLSAPSPTWHVTFLTHGKLDPGHALGGSRHISLNISTGPEMKATLRPESGELEYLWVVDSTGYAFLSYTGADKGEGHVLDLDLKTSWELVRVKLSEAPRNGVLKLTLRSKKGFHTLEQPIDGPGDYDFKVKDFGRKVNLQSVNGINLSIEVLKPVKEAKFILKSISLLPPPSGFRR